MPDNEITILKSAVPLTDELNQDNELLPSDRKDAQDTYYPTQEEQALIDLVHTRLVDSDQMRRPAETRAIESLAMYRGGSLQWGRWNAYSRSWEDLRWMSSADDYRIYLVSNRLRPKVRKLASRAASANVSISLRPRTDMPNDKNGVRKARAVLADLDEQFNRADQLLQAIRAAIIVGDVFQKTWFDKNAMVDTPVIDEQGNITEIKQTRAGKMCNSLFTLFEVGGDPKATKILDGGWILHYGQVPLTELSEEFENGKFVTAEAQASGPGGRIDALLDAVTEQLQRGTTGSGTKVATRIEMWEKPSESYEKGRYVIVAGDVLLYSGEWPYEKLIELEMFPIAQLGYEPGIETPWSDNAIYPVLDILRARNRALSLIQEHLRAGWGKILSPRGANIHADAFKMGRANEVIEYDVNELTKGTPPQYLPPPPTDPNVLESIKILDDDFNEQLGVNEVDEGGVPPGVQAAAAIQQLHDASQSDSVLFRQEIESFRERIATIELAIAQQCYTSDRLLAVSDLSEADLKSLNTLDENTKMEQAKATISALLQAGVPGQQIPAVMQQVKQQGQTPGQGPGQPTPAPTTVNTGKPDPMAAVMKPVKFPDGFNLSRIIVDAASSSPQTPAARIQQVLDMAKNGMFQPENLPMTIPLLGLMELEEEDKLTADLLAALQVWQQMQKDMQQEQPQGPPPPPSPADIEAAKQTTLQVQAQIAAQQRHEEAMIDLQKINAENQAKMVLAQQKHVFDMELEGFKGQQNAAVAAVQAKTENLDDAEKQMDAEMKAIGLKEGANLSPMQLPGMPEAQPAPQAAPAPPPAPQSNTPTGDQTSLESGLQ